MAAAANHPGGQSTLASMYDQDYMEKTSDVEFKFPNDERLYAHRPVLGTVSEHFRLLFYGAMKTPKGVAVEVTFPKKTFVAVLDYIYLCKTRDWSMNEARSILEAANYYQVTGLIKCAEKRVLCLFNTMVMDLEAAYELYDFADHNNNVGIKRGLVVMIRTGIVSNMEAKTSFRNMPLHLLQSVCEVSPHVAANLREIDMFWAILAWACIPRQGFRRQGETRPRVPEGKYDDALKLLDKLRISHMRKQDLDAIWNQSFVHDNKRFIDGIFRRVMAKLPADALDPVSTVDDCM